MVLNLNQPIDLVQPAMASSVLITSFTVLVSEGKLSICYIGGNYDANGVFVQVGVEKVLNVEGASFAAMLAANPALYPSLKAVLYAVLTQALGLQGTIA